MDSETKNDEFSISLEKVQQRTAVPIAIREHTVKRIKQRHSKRNSEMCTSAFF
jgi:hypothetical protein